jgi:hypothetical protein
MPPMVIYALKCAGAAFAMFLIGGAIGSLLIGERQPEELSEAQAFIALIAMIGGAGIAWYWFWPRFPRS